MNRMIIGSLVALLGAASACRYKEPPARPPEVPPAPSSSSITPGASLAVPEGAARERAASLASSTPEVDHAAQVTSSRGPMHK